VIYFADLHIHSRYSRATSKECNLVELARWAALKGIRVLATGDFTHPEWRREIRETLEEADDGLLRLKSEHVPESSNLPGGLAARDVRFILNVEISSIYKKNGATRKVHNLVFMPDMDAMERFGARLARIGNIKSDGRPILGLDSRDLLEIAMETTPESFLIPAHVWTPWFSILGSKSGFDSVEECFEDLTPHIFALETGLSSDPEMNHRVGLLDPYTLVSNSDSHSPSRLGREVNILAGSPGYEALREAIRAGGKGIRIHEDREPWTGNVEDIVDREISPGSSSFIGTIEFFPEEGKYHLDGHRKCSVRMEPEDTEKTSGKCPVCGHPVTVGVMNRVNELAGRAPGTKPERAARFWKMLPLHEIIAQAMNVGVQSKKVSAFYREMISRLGPELLILWALPVDEIASQVPEIIVEGIRRVRNGEVSIKAGYDGEYGTVELFTPGEHEHFGGQDSFLSVEAPKPRRPARRDDSTEPHRKKAKGRERADPEEVDNGLNQEQQEAVAVLDKPVLVQAGPGTGKTRTLCHRVAELILSGAAQPCDITAVTFTRKAAQEVRERLVKSIPDGSIEGCWVGTFHQLGTRILSLCTSPGDGIWRDRILDRNEALAVFRQATKRAVSDYPTARIARLFDEVSLLKQNLVPVSDTAVTSPAREAYIAYEKLLHEEHAFDLDDLVAKPVAFLKENPEEASRVRATVGRHLLVDEFQDVNRAQYEMVTVLACPDGAGLFAIGDPDQAIYGFRGSDSKFFQKFAQDYPETCRVQLTKNYRSQEAVLSAAQGILAGEGEGLPLVAQRDRETAVKMALLPSGSSEGEFIARTIERLIGGSSFFSMDAGRVIASSREFGFQDFAVLYRLNAIGDMLEEALSNAGIPFQRARRANPEDEAEAFDPRAEAVALMTIHAAKGLEFPVVFIAGCEDGIIPCKIMAESEGHYFDMDEEKRLLYVAMTRARDELFITRSARRVLYGRELENPPSRFFDSVDQSLYEFLKPLEGRQRRDRGPSQGELF